MRLYFLLIRIAALCGHKKAQLLVRGQRDTLVRIKQRDEVAAKEVVWFHSASVGEFEQARPIIERLKSQDNAGNVRVVLTFFSPSGYEMRKNYAFADEIYYLPFATRRNAKAFIAAIRPTKVIFVKYEFWPAYLRELKAQMIPTYLISAIFRPGQLFFRWWGKWYRNLLHCFTKIFVQDEDSCQLLAKYNILRVLVAGDTRFDRVHAIAEQSNAIPIIEHFANVTKNVFQQTPNRVIIAGSTWLPDEELLARYVNEHEDVKLVLVPHEIDKAHLDAIFNLFQGRLVRLSEANAHSVEHVRTILVDSMGLLSSIYRYGQVAYIGGGFGVGIHNTIEAAVYGVPVLFGPNYQHFREAKGLIAANAGFSVANYYELAAALDKALEEHVRLGLNARDYVNSELGATERIMKSIF